MAPSQADSSWCWWSVTDMMSIFPNFQIIACTQINHLVLQKGTQGKNLLCEPIPPHKEALILALGWRHGSTMAHRQAIVYPVMRSRQATPSNLSQGQSDIPSTLALELFEMAAILQLFALTIPVTRISESKMQPLALKSRTRWG